MAKKILFWITIGLIIIIATIQTILLSTILFKFIAEALAVPTTLLVILAINIKPTKNIKKDNYKENNAFNITNIIEKNYKNNYTIKYNVKLSNIINMNDSKLKNYKSESNRTIDICIQDKMNNNTLLLISINTNDKDDIKDTKLRVICNLCNIKFVNFWSKYQNSEDYIIEQINKNLGR